MQELRSKKCLWAEQSFLRPDYCTLGQTQPCSPVCHPKFLCCSLTSNEIKAKRVLLSLQAKMIVPTLKTAFPSAAYGVRDWVDDMPGGDRINSGIKWAREEWVKKSTSRQQKMPVVSWMSKKKRFDQMEELLMPRVEAGMLIKTLPIESTLPSTPTHTVVQLNPVKFASWLGVKIAIKWNRNVPDRL